MSTNPLRICPKCGGPDYGALFPHYCPPDVVRDARIAELEAKFALTKRALELACIGFRDWMSGDEEYQDGDEMLPETNSMMNSYIERARKEMADAG